MFIESLRCFKFHCVNLNNMQMNCVILVGRNLEVTREEKRATKLDPKGNGVSSKCYVRQ